MRSSYKVEAGDFMRSKVLIVTLVAILLFSVLSLASASFQCPKCHGSGVLTITETCPTCKGAYIADARVTVKRTFAWGSESAIGPATSVSGVFRNEEELGVYGVMG